MHISFPNLTADQRDRFKPLLTSSYVQRGRPFRNYRHVEEGIPSQYRHGTDWRGLPEQFSRCQTVCKSHRRFESDGIWDLIHTALGSLADTAGRVNWTV